MSDLQDKLDAARQSPGYWKEAHALEKAEADRLRAELAILTKHAPNRARSIVKMARENERLENELADLRRRLAEAESEIAGVKRELERHGIKVPGWIEHYSEKAQAVVRDPLTLEACLSFAIDEIKDEAERAGMERANGLQARIDALMLEYCPDEMTPEQIENFAEHQRKASPEEEAAIDAAAQPGQVVVRHDHGKLALPLQMVSEPASDWGWYIADADGEEVEMDDIIDAINQLAKQQHPDGYAVTMANGRFVGIWQDLDTAKMVVGRNPQSEGEQVRAMYFAAPMMVPVGDVVDAGDGRVAVVLPLVTMLNPGDKVYGIGKGGAR